MANYTKFWKVWLRLNLLTKDVDNDYTAEVSTMKNSLRNEDIAQRIVNEGSEYKYDTLLSIINQHDRIIREAVMDGYSVLTKTCQYTPRVLGPWIGSSAKFDPEKHKVTLDITLSSEMREALSHVGVEVLTVKDSGANIGLVIDTVTGLSKIPSLPATISVLKAKRSVYPVKPQVSVSSSSPATARSIPSLAA